MTTTPLPLETEPLTGLPSWPVGVLAGVEGSGKTASAIAASASDMVGRTFYLAFGEKRPDEYGLIPGQRVEFVKYDGTYRGLLDTITACKSQARVEPDRPNLIILDGATKLWGNLSNNAQESANHRARGKGKYVGEDGADIGRDLWNSATSRFENVINALKEHDGPVLITCRLDLISGTDERTGQPTKEKLWKLAAQKMFPYEVDFIVQMRTSYPESDTWLSKVQSMRYQHKTGRDGKIEYRPLQDFTVEGLWKNLGLDEVVTPREYVTPVVQSEYQQTIERDEILQDVIRAATAAGYGTNVIASRWAETHNGQRIDQTTDLAGLRAVLATLLERAQAAPAHTPDQAHAHSEPAHADDAPAHQGAPPPPERAQYAPDEDVRANPEPALADAVTPAGSAPAPGAIPGFQFTPAPADEPRPKKQPRLLRDELRYHAYVLGAPEQEYMAGLLDGTGVDDDTRPAQMLKAVKEGRPAVIEALRAQLRSTEAEVLTNAGEAGPINLEAELEHALAGI